VGFGEGYIGQIGNTVATGAASIADDLRRYDFDCEGHPESFQLELDGTRVFVNVADSREVRVFDRSPLGARAPIAVWWVCICSLLMVALFLSLAVQQCRQSVGASHAHV
jgi:hypothetical protein